MEMYDDASLEGPGDSSSTENLVTSSRKCPSNPFGKRSHYSDYIALMKTCWPGLSKTHTRITQSQRPRQ